MEKVETSKRTQKEESYMRNSFVFYRSYSECIKQLPVEYKEKMLDAIIEYGLNGAEPDDSDPIIKAMMINIIPNIDSSNNRYDTAKANGARGREYGSLGGRPSNAIKQQIISLRDKGWSAQKISEELNISLKTVQNNIGG